MNSLPASAQITQAQKIKDIRTPQQCPSCGHYEPFHDVDCEAEIARVLEKLRKQEAA